MRGGSISMGSRRRRPGGRTPRCWSPVAMGERRAGWRPLALGWGLLLGGAAVHGRGMAEPLAVVGIDAAGSGDGQRQPRSRVGGCELAGAAAVLELPAR